MYIPQSNTSIAISISNEVKSDEKMGILNEELIDEFQQKLDDPTSKGKGTFSGIIWR